MKKKMERLTGPLFQPLTPRQIQRTVGRPGRPERRLAMPPLARPASPPADPGGKSFDEAFLEELRPGTNTELILAP